MVSLQFEMNMRPVKWEALRRGIELWVQVMRMRDDRIVKVVMLEALRNGDVAASAMAEHVFTTGHKVDLSKATVIYAYPYTCFLHFTLCLTSPPVCTCIHTLVLVATFVNY